MRAGSIKPVVDRLDAERTASQTAKEESSQAKDVDVYSLLELLLEPVRARDGALLKERIANHRRTILTRRGVVQETVLHLCFLRGTPECKTLAAHLVHRFGAPLCNARYESPQYHGEVALHIAIVNKDLEAVKMLVANGADVNEPRADGHFFQRPVATADGNAERARDVDESIPGTQLRLVLFTDRGRSEHHLRRIGGCVHPPEKGESKNDELVVLGSDATRFRFGNESLHASFDDRIRQLGTRPCTLPGRHPAIDSGEQHELPLLGRDPAPQLAPAALELRDRLVELCGPLRRSDGAPDDDTLARTLTHPSGWWNRARNTLRASQARPAM